MSRVFLVESVTTVEMAKHGATHDVIARTSGYAYVRQTGQQTCREAEDHE